jgi:hypothetical protein
VQARDHARQVEAAVEAALHLSEVAGGVLVELEAMIRALDGALEVAKEGVHPVKAVQLRALSRADDHALVACDQFCGSGEAG